MYQDNVRLTAENERLLQWQQIGLKLSADNRDLRGLLKSVPEAAVSYVTARVIANSGGGYVRTVMVNGGPIRAWHADRRRLPAKASSGG